MPSDLKALSAKWRRRAFIVLEDAGDEIDRCADDLDAALSAQGAAPEPQTAQGWQPIATAPKDGRGILVHGGVARWHVGDDCDGAWYSITGYKYPGRPIDWPVTHWMPLPVPPTGETP